MFTEKDLQQFDVKGITISQIEKQLELFEAGFPFLKIVAPASINNGILSLTDNEKQEYIRIWEQYIQDNDNVAKFVPASGAASRMFKSLFNFLSSTVDIPHTDEERLFFDNIHHFAFYEKLNNLCKEKLHKNIDELLKENIYKPIVELLLTEKGLNYGNKPKGLLDFHLCKNEVVTPLEEHLCEAILYTKHGRNAKIHFTISREHRKDFETLANKLIEKYKTTEGIDINITFSEQSGATDTIAVDMDNQPFRDDNDSIVFRPGGHGALIENLNQIEADVVFVKNIDNVCQQNYINEIVEYKKILGGILINTQRKIAEQIEKLSDCNSTNLQTICEEAVDFLQDTLMTHIPDIKHKSDEELVAFIKDKLHRPIRVCGVVKNIGEPGGGPFIIEENDGSYSLQILESSQIDVRNEKDVKMFKEGTHFNPVDLVCYLTDTDGQRFNLHNYVDTKTGFISKKSLNGIELKALELPGLWNGGMSRWNTLFVEVPLVTFNPVKTINDLLRPEHQA